MTYTRKTRAIERGEAAPIVGIPAHEKPCIHCGKPFALEFKGQTACLRCIETVQNHNQPWWNVNKKTQYARNLLFVGWSSTDSPKAFEEYAREYVHFALDYCQSLEMDWGRTMRDDAGFTEPPHEY